MGDIAQQIGAKRLVDFFGLVVLLAFSREQFFSDCGRTFYRCNFGQDLHQIRP